MPDVTNTAGEALKKLTHGKEGTCIAAPSEKIMKVLTHRSDF